MKLFGKYDISQFSMRGGVSPRVFWSIVGVLAVCVACLVYNIIVIVKVFA